MTQHHNIDITLKTTNNTTKKEIKQILKEKLKQKTPEEKILNIEMISKIEKVNQ